MSKTQATQEPSMEEILSSIRRIISEDETDPNAPKAGAPADAGAGQPGGDAPAPANEADPPITLHADPADQPGAGDAGNDAEAAFAAPAGADAPAAEQGAGAQPAGFGAGFGASFGAGFGDSNEDAADAGAEAPEDEDVLDLTEMVASDGRVVKITPQGLSNTGGDPVVAQNGLDHEAPAMEEAPESGPATFGASFGAAAEAAPVEDKAADVEPAKAGFAEAEPAKAETAEAETVEADAGDAEPVDEVSYADADLSGTPAYMAAAEADEVVPEATETFEAPAEPEDAFAELAGADQEEKEQAMTDNTPHDQAAPAQPSFGSGSFQEAAPAAHVESAPAQMADGSSGLDAMIQRMAEPMVRQWIEQNMQQVIESIVRDEVARRLSGS